MRHDREAQLGPQLPQPVHPGLGAVAEAKVIALMDGNSAQRLLKHALGEAARALLREGFGERQNHGRVHARAGQQSEALLQRRKQQGRLGRSQHPQRVRIKGDHHGLSLHSAGAFTHVGEDGAMAAVHAVEVADGNHAARS